MPLCLDKCIVLQCDSNQPFNVYTIGDPPIASVNLFKDSSVMRSANGRYKEHCKIVYAKAWRMTGAVWGIFQSKHLSSHGQLTSYILLIITYSSPGWNALLGRDSKLIEEIQQWFTKYVAGLRQLSYVRALTSWPKRLYADMVIVYKVIHGL